MLKNLFLGSGPVLGADKTLIIQAIFKSQSLGNTCNAPNEQEKQRSCACVFCNIKDSCFHITPLQTLVAVIGTDESVGFEASTGAARSLINVLDYFLTLLCTNYIFLLLI